MILTKSTLLKYIGELPEQFSIDELMDKIMFINKVEQGLEQSKNDKTIPHDQVKDRIKKWLE